MPSVAELIRERFGELTPIQKLAMPKVLAGKNVLILAPTGSGKCVSGDTVIFTDEGPDKIENLYNKHVRVTSIDQKLKIRFSNGIIIQKQKSELFKVGTDSGKHVKVTHDHRFLTLNEGILEWKMLKDLKENDFIACARKIPLV